MNMKSHIIGSWVIRFFLAGFLLGSLVGFSSITIAQTGEPSREPILRIETGRHSAPIWKISTDAQNRFFVTASDDKTARVWQASTGRLLRVLRPPIGRNLDGILLAVALSADGNTVAIAGETGFEWDRAGSIYIFDRESGRLIRRITGLPEEILDLVYSPDGRWLAATLGVGGIRIYETKSYTQMDSDSGGMNDRADFDSQGRVVTSCFDGTIRLYQLTNGHLRQLVKRSVSSGSLPLRVRFSPDGSKIAAGFRDSNSVAVLSSKDLTVLYQPSLSGVDNGNLSSVAWSMDGSKLYAAGRYNKRLQFQIREWADGGRGEPRDISVAVGVIFDLLPLRDGGIAYATGEPSWGQMDTQGRRIVLSGEDTTNYTSVTSPCERRSHLQLSVDGTFLQYPWWESVLSFSVLARQLGAQTTSIALTPPRTTGLNITDWCNNTAPKLNGKTLPIGKLYRDEESRSLAIAPDYSSFALGTSFAIQLFDRNGKELWTAPIGQTGMVNISGDGKLLVATSTDNIIRWHRMTDGKQLLAFFPHPDGKRWVLWTPSGYYDASPGAEELIGWHVNNGKDQAADFFPVGQFRSIYYRPDVISKILEAGDEARAVQLANEERGRKSQSASVAQMLPPIVEIASPADNSEVSTSEITVRYSLRTPSGEPVTNVRALVDGRPVSGNRQLTREEASAPGVRELKLSMPEQDSEVSIIAENRFAASVPATIRLKWHGAAPTTEAFVIQPKLYVLAIGVSQYQNPSYSLKFAAKDAQDFAAAATIQKGLLYRDVVVKVLTDQHANKDEILDGLDWIRKETTSKDVAMVFFAGHGLNDQNGVYYFLPYNTDLEKLLRTGVPFTDIKNTVQSLAGKTLFFIDTCHSGNVLGGRRGLADDLNGVINELASAESGAVVFAASTGNQSSFEDAKWNNGAFTKALVEGITGRADYTGKGKITVNMLDLYLSERVKELTGGKQTPTTAKPNTVPDFPIAVKR